MKKPQHIVIVDDDATSNQITEFQIRRWNSSAKIEVFRDSGKALESIRDHYMEVETQASTLLFLDLNMPGLSGRELLEAFQNFPEALHRQYLIYILSASPKDPAIDYGDFSFVKAFLSKPLSPKSLEEIESKDPKDP